MPPESGAAAGAVHPEQLLAAGYAAAITRPRPVAGDAGVTGDDVTVEAAPAPPPANRLREQRHRHRHRGSRADPRHPQARRAKAISVDTCRSVSSTTREPCPASNRLTSYVTSPRAASASR